MDSYRSAALEDLEIAEGREASIRDAIERIKDVIRQEVERQEPIRQAAMRALWVGRADCWTVEHFIACLSEVVDDAWHEVLREAESAEAQFGDVVRSIHDAERAADFADQGRL